MSPSDSEKSGFELDVVDLSSLSSKKPDRPKVEEPPAQPEETFAPVQEETPPQTEHTLADVPITRSKTAKSIAPIIWIVLAVIAAGTISFFLLMKTDRLPLTENKNIPPQFNQSIVRFAGSIEKMKIALKTLDNASNRINSKQKITTIFESIENVERQLPLLEKNKQLFLRNVNQFLPDLESEGNGMWIAVGNFYNNAADTKFFSALQEFLEVQKKYLTYFYNNYEKIHEQQQPQIYTYEKYYLEYTRSIEKFDQAADQVKKSIYQVLQEYPQAKPLFLQREDSAIFKIE